MNDYFQHKIEDLKRSKKGSPVLLGEFGAHFRVLCSCWQEDGWQMPRNNVKVDVWHCLSGNRSVLQSHLTRFCANNALHRSVCQFSGFQQIQSFCFCQIVEILNSANRGHENVPLKCRTQICEYICQFSLIHDEASINLEICEEKRAHPFCKLAKYP